MPWPSWPDGIVPAETVTAAWLTNVSTSLAFLEEVAYQEFTGDVSVTPTTSATSTLVVSSGAITYEAVPHLLEFYSPYVETPANSGARIFIGLYDNGAANGVARIVEQRTNTAGQIGTSVYAARRLTPTAASHTYEVRAYVNVASAGTVGAGAGGNDVRSPGFIRITKVPA